MEDFGSMFSSRGELIGLAGFVDLLIEGGGNSFAYKAAKDDAESQRTNAVVGF